MIANFIINSLKTVKIADLELVGGIEEEEAKEQDFEQDNEKQEQVASYELNWHGFDAKILQFYNQQKIFWDWTAFF